jgi:hypothetical protein
MAERAGARLMRLFDRSEHMLVLWSSPLLQRSRLDEGQNVCEDHIEHDHNPEY